MFAFADDLAVVVHNPKIGEANRKMSLVYDIIRQHAISRRIEFSDTKVKAMVFTGRHRVRKGCKGTTEKVTYTKSISEDGVIVKGYVEEVTSYKYLGMIIDPKLSMNEWCTKIATEVRKRTATIMKLARFSNMRRAHCEMFYRGYVRGYLNYGSALWSTSSSRSVIECADREGLRILCGALKTTSNAALMEESNLESITMVAQRKTLSVALRLNNVPRLDFLRQSVWERSGVVSRAVVCAWETNNPEQLCGLKRASLVDTVYRIYPRKLPVGNERDMRMIES